MGKFQQIASVFMGLFVYSAALIGVFKNRWKVMFGKWSIIMPEFLLRVPRWSELGGASDLGLSIVGINYNPIITSIVWTLSCELLQLCSPSLFCQCSIRWQSRDRWSVFVWFIKNIFSMLVWDKSIRSVIAGHDTRYIFTHVLFLQIFMRSLAHTGTVTQELGDIQTWTEIHARCAKLF